MINRQRRKKGWQVYGSNAPVEKVSAADLVMTYRNQYRIEHIFDYLINRDTGLLPLFLKKENRVKGLIRLLMVAMRFSCLTQNIVREALLAEKEELGELYAGNKGRKTNRPTTPMILRAMRGISVVFMEFNEQRIIKMSDLTPIQVSILKFSNASDAYANFIKLLSSQRIIRET